VNQNFLQNMVTMAQCAALLVSLLIPVAPIYAQTQAEMNATAREDFARADADLNKTYQAVLAKLVDSERKQKLKEKQRAWVASRDAEVARATNEANGGSMAPMLRYETMTELTRERIKELKIQPKDASSARTPRPSISSVSGPASPPEPASQQAGSISQTPAPTVSPNPSSVSPDKKWEYVGGATPKLVKAGTNENALEFSEECNSGGCEISAPVWAPD
jgi:uncharacterized protein YecT (DUF1311 family)